MPKISRWKNNIVNRLCQQLFKILSQDNSKDKFRRRISNQNILEKLFSFNSKNKKMFSRTRKRRGFLFLSVRSSNDSSERRPSWRNARDFFVRTEELRIDLRAQKRVKCSYKKKKCQSILHNASNTNPRRFPDWSKNSYFNSRNMLYTKFQSKKMETAAFDAMAWSCVH